MKSMTKILFIDVDGTLTNYENQIPLSAKTAIKMTRARGNRVYICTGRSRAEVYSEIWDIGLDGMIGGNGSYIEDEGKVIFHNHLTQSECRSVVDYLAQEGLDFYLESNNGLFASPNFENGALKAIQEYSKKKGKSNAGTLSVRDAFPDMIFGANLYRDDVNKISYVLKTYSDFEKTAKKFSQMQCGTWGGEGGKALFGDIGVKDITKESAINCLLSHLGAKKEQTIAFGDAAVDIPMFKACALSVAVASGSQEARDAATLTTESVDEDGLYNAFSRLGLL